jgi:hypothetical protein
MLVVWVVVGGIFHKAADRHAMDQPINGQKAFLAYINFSGIMKIQPMDQSPIAQIQVELQ